MGPIFLKVKTETVERLIHQKRKGYLTYDEIDDLLPSNTVFPERSVIR